LFSVVGIWRYAGPKSLFLSLRSGRGDPPITTGQMVAGKAEVRVHADVVCARATTPSAAIRGHRPDTRLAN